MAGERTPSRWPIRGLLGLGVFVGVVLAAYFLVPSSVQPAHRPLGRDFYIYYASAGAFLRGEPFVGYTAAFGGRELSYVYPPITILPFVPYALLPGWSAAFVVHALLDAGAMLGVAALVVRTVERNRGPLPTVDRLLIGGFCLARAFSMMAIGLGQIDPLIALGLAGAFVAVETDREPLAGAAVALAGVFKLVPGLVGLWLLYRRAWRAVEVAVGVGLASLAASLLLFGVDAHLAFIRHVLTVRSRLVAFGSSGGGIEFSVTLAQPLAFLFPGLDPAFYPLVAAALLAPVLVALYRRDGDVVDRLVAFLGTLSAVLLVSPASNFTWVVYLYFPLLSLLYLLEDRAARRVLLAGLALLSVPLQRYQPRAVAALSGHEGAYAATVGPAVEAVLAFGTVPLYGIVLLLVGCAAFHLSAAGGVGRRRDATADD